MDLEQIIKLPSSDFLNTKAIEEITSWSRYLVREEINEAYRLYLGLQKKLKELENFAQSSEYVAYQNLIAYLRKECLPYLDDADLFDFVQTRYIKDAVPRDEYDLPLNKRIESNLLLSFEYQNILKTKGIINALKNNEESLGSVPIAISKLNKSLPPVAKNWILDYDYAFGIDPQPKTSIARYINQSKNAQSLNPHEIEALKNMLQMYEQMKMLNFVFRSPDLVAGFLEKKKLQNNKKRNIQTLIERQQRTLPVKQNPGPPQLKSTPVPKKEISNILPQPQPTNLIPPQKPQPQLPAKSASQAAQPQSQPKPPAAHAEVIPYYANSILEKIIRVERLRNLSDEQKKRLELIIGQVLRELKTKDDAIKTLAAPMEQGGIGFGTSQAQRIAGLIIPFAAEARQEVIRNNLKKKTLSNQKVQEVETGINKELSSQAGAQQARASTSTSASPQKPLSPQPNPSQQKPAILNSPTEIARLTIAKIRGTNKFAVNLAMLKEGIRQLLSSRRASLPDVMKAWKQSEMYRVYLELGRESMTKKLPVGAIARERAAQQKPYLTEQEFVIIADFMKDLQTLS